MIRAFAVVTLVLAASACKTRTKVTTRTEPVGAPAPARRPEPAAPPTAAAAAALTGAATPRAAMEGFLTSVREQDFQKMSLVWGTKGGPARDLFERRELEMREFLLQCWFAHERFRVVNDAPGDQPGKRVFTVELARGALSGRTNVYVVEGPAQRWFVENIDREPVKSLNRCRDNPGAGPPGTTGRPPR